MVWSSVSVIGVAITGAGGNRIGVADTEIKDFVDDGVSTGDIGMDVVDVDAGTDDIAAEDAMDARTDGTLKVLDPPSPSP